MVDLSGTSDILKSIYHWLDEHAVPSEMEKLYQMLLEVGLEEGDHVIIPSDLYEREKGLILKRMFNKYDLVQLQEIEKRLPEIINTTKP